MSGADDSLPGFGDMPLRDALLNGEALTLLAVVSMLVLMRVSARPRTGGFPLSPTLIAGLLGGGTLLTFFFCAEWGITRLPIALALASALVVSLVGPVEAVCLLMAVLILRPWEVMEPQDVMSTIPRTFGWVTIVCVVAWLPARFSETAFDARSRISLVLHPATLLPVALASWLFVGAAGTGDPGSVQASVSAAFIPITCVALVIFVAVRRRTDINAVAAALLIAITGIEWIALYRTLGEETLIVELVVKRLKAVGMLEDPNDTSALAVMVFPFAAGFVLRKGGPWLVRVAAFASAVTTLVSIHYAQSRGALMALFACFATYVLIRMLRHRIRPLLMVGLAIFLLIPVGVKFNRSADDTDASTQSRLNYWKAAARMAVDNPVFGVGFGQFPLRYDEYAPENTVEWGKRTAHSSWALILAEGGFPALFILWALVAIALWQAWRVRDEYPELVCSLVGYMLAISFLSQTYYLYPYALFALALAAARELRPSRSTIDEKIRPLGSPQMAVAGS